jgi:integrase/recombinase XerC
VALRSPPAAAVPGGVPAIETVEVHGVNASAILEGWRLDQQRRGLMPATIVRRSTMIRGWIRWCTAHDLQLDQAAAEDVNRFLDAKHIGARTRYTWLSALHCFYEWARRAGHLTTDPTADIMRPKLRRTLPRPVSDADLAMAIAMAPPQERRWCILAAYAGLRCGEISHLRRDDVLWDQELLHVTGKGARDRMVPMAPIVLEALDSWPTPRQNRTLFTRPAGGAWTPALLSRHASVYLHSIGIDATLHQFRHWFGTRTLNASKNLRTVQGLLGHASPTTTAIYTEFSDEDARAAVRLLSAPQTQPSMF